MSNTAVTGIYIPFLLIVIIVFVSVLMNYLRTRRNIMLVFLSLCIVGWISTDIAVLLVRDPALNLFTWNIGLIFVGFAPLLSFLVFFRFYRQERKIPKLVLFLLFLIPTLNVLVVLTSYTHTLIRDVEVLSVWPIRDVVVTWNVWFWVHTSFCYAMAVASAVVALSGYIKAPKYYRIPSFLLIAALFVMLLGNHLFIVKILPSNFDPTGIGAAFSMLLVFFALSDSSNNLFVNFARGQLFSYLEDYILILNKDGHIVDFNPSAERWFSTFKRDFKSRSLQETLAILEQNGASIKEGPEGKGDQDIWLTNGAFPLILNFRTYKVLDGNANTVGSIATFTNVTQNRIALDLLEKKAGVDYLTGLANRTAYEGAKVRFDSENHLPLSVIMCDINGLKEANDTLGHSYGDLLIQVTAEVLRQVVSNPFFVARIGGDEFICLLPCVDSEYANKLIEQIREAALKCGSHPFAISIALGTATKQSAEENIDEIIALADQRTYADKHIHKSRMYGNQKNARNPGI